MFYFLDTKKSFYKFAQSVLENCNFESATIYRQNAQDVKGIKLVFEDQTSGMLWKINNKRYYFNFKAFDTIVKFSIPVKIGDSIWKKFLYQFDGKYIYADV